MKNFKKELTENILPFWINKMQDDKHGGFYGQIDGNNALHAQANKGAIMNARILWTFSAAYRVLKKEEYLIVANRAYNYISEHFIDPKHGGVYWELDYKGNPINRKKQTYAQGFVLYGLSEFYRATKKIEALEKAKEFFYLIEKCRDPKLGGYWEAFTEDWQPIEDMRLSDKDENEKKTMNTHLHVLEPYTNLCRIWNNNRLKDAQKELINLFLDQILDKDSSHLNLFFDENWNVKSTAISYGHDIEASWLLYEASVVLGNNELLAKVKDISLQIAESAMQGLKDDGSLIYEKKQDHLDLERHWWVQAEAVVGFMYAYHNSKNQEFQNLASKTWEYIQQQLIDTLNGEWYWSRYPDGSVNKIDDKAGFWKCPYHNGRMCLEMIENFNITE